MVKLTIKQAQKIQLFLPNFLMLAREAILNGKKHIFINEYEYQLALNKQKEHNANQKVLANCAKANNKGKVYEKEGKIKQAVRVYEKNIEYGCYPAHYSFKRLMLIYRSNKDYENEKRVITRALEEFPAYPEYTKRLEKVRILIDKQK